MTMKTSTGVWTFLQLPAAIWWSCDDHFCHHYHQHSITHQSTTTDSNGVSACTCRGVWQQNRIFCEEKNLRFFANYVFSQKLNNEVAKQKLLVARRFNSIENESSIDVKNIVCSKRLISARLSADRSIWLDGWWLAGFPHSVGRLLFFFMWLTPEWANGDQNAHHFTNSHEYRHISDASSALSLSVCLHEDDNIFLGLKPHGWEW